MTEHTLQTLADTQSILGVLENYLQLYDRQNRELENLRQKPVLATLLRSGNWDNAS